jgi:DNA-binding Lrp family transcriptional regulator
MSVSRGHLDSTDRLILDELRNDARQPAAAIAEKANLTSSAVRRRIAQLERAGVISQYTVVLGPKLEEEQVSAYVEVEIGSGFDMHEFMLSMLEFPQIREVAMIAGNPDAILHVRAKHMDDLGSVIADIRRRASVVGSKTMIVMAKARHRSEVPEMDQATRVRAPNRRGQP